MKALQNQAVVSSEAPIVFSAIPRNSLRDRVGLIQFAPRRRVIQPAERSEADSRESPVKGIIRNPADPRTTRSGNVQDVRIEVGRGNMIVVVVHAERVCHAALTVGPPRAGVEPLRSRSPRGGGERIDDIVRTARPVQSRIDVVLRATSASAASTTPACDDRAGTGSPGRPKIV